MPTLTIDHEQDQAEFEADMAYMRGLVAKIEAAL